MKEGAAITIVLSLIGILAHGPIGGIAGLVISLVGSLSLFLAFLPITGNIVQWLFLKWAIHGILVWLGLPASSVLTYSVPIFVGIGAVITIVVVVFVASEFPK